MSAFEEFKIEFSTSDFDEVTKLIPKNQKGYGKRTTEKTKKERKNENVQKKQKKDL